MNSSQAAAVTYLEMRSAEELCPKQNSDRLFQIQERPPGRWDINRSLYLDIGKSWQWNDKRHWTDDEWRSYAESKNLRTFIACRDEKIVGYFELQKDDENQIEIAYFGLIPEYCGRGLGGAMLTSALQLAWQANPTRVWVHTCTNDHNAAISNYLARGFKIYKTESHAT